MNRKVTAAASQYSPMITAPVTAMVTRASIPTMRYLSAPMAFLKTGVPAITVVASIRNIVIFSYPIISFRTKDAAARIPEMRTIRPFVIFIIFIIEDTPFFLLFAQDQVAQAFNFRPDLFCGDSALVKAHLYS